MEYKKIWEKALDLIKHKIRIILMVVAESEGSSPGRPGFKMLVSETGELFGSIGGGLMEFNFVEYVKIKFQNDDYSYQVLNVIHDKESVSNSSGMICSGSQSIIIIPLLEKNLEVLENIILSINDSKRGVVRISNSSLNFTSGAKNNQNFIFQEVNELEWMYEENIGEKNTIYIVGGGHVGLALSRVMSILDFHVVVLDPRSEIDTFKNNRFANEKIVIPYETVSQKISEGDNIFVVIMTNGHIADERVLKDVIKKEVKYIGMMGSPNKVKQVFDNLREQGIADYLLQKVKAPIGLPINSETPEEIAISIAAEIIKISKQ